MHGQREWRRQFTDNGAGGQARDPDPGDSTPETAARRAGTAPGAASIQLHMNQYIYKSATELAGLIRDGKATSTAIVSAHLERIRNVNGRLNALINVFEEEALQEAALCDKEAEEGRFRGPLHGVPITIKEQFWIKGKKSNTNFKMLKDFVAPEDAVVVDRIRKSGAIILGQTNVPKNLLDYQVAGDIYPEGVNPYNVEYSPGGSTGGGAAALAAGLTPLELGGDFGGSIRVPANFCGLYGLKPRRRPFRCMGICLCPRRRTPSYCTWCRRVHWHVPSRMWNCSGE